MKKKEIASTMAKKYKMKIAVENLQDEQRDWFTLLLEHTDIIYINPGKKTNSTLLKQMELCK